VWSAIKYTNIGRSRSQVFSRRYLHATLIRPEANGSSMLRLTERSNLCVTTYRQTAFK
jgi:hypothetical protein